MKYNFVEKERKIIVSVSNFIKKYLDNPFDNAHRMSKFLRKWVLNFCHLEHHMIVVIVPDGNNTLQHVVLDCVDTQIALGQIVASNVPQNLISMQFYTEQDFEYKTKLQNSLIEVVAGIELITMKNNSCYHLHTMIQMFYNYLESYFKNRDDYNYYLDSIDKPTDFGAGRTEAATH